MLGEVLLNELFVGVVFLGHEELKSRDCYVTANFTKFSDLLDLEHPEADCPPRLFEHFNAFTIR
jgi:hypothetical protein